tara:strand:- start:20409 stop:21488 length:1080 start_codon:yes stop_codon:yes gene_type:complete
MKKVLFITARADTGGGPKHVYDLALQLKSFGYEVIIAAPNDKPFGEKFRKDWSYIEIGHRNFSLLTFLKLLFYCRTENVDLIHSHGRGAGLYSRLLGLFNFKVIHTFHGVHNEKSLTGKIKLGIDVFLKNLSDLNICVSEDEKKLGVDLGVTEVERAIVVSNGVNLDQIKKEEKMDLRSIYSFSQDSILIGTLARLNYQKGIDLLLNILSKQKVPSQWKFLIAGEGEEHDVINKMIHSAGLSEKVYLIGNCSTPISFLKGLDIYFSTSRWEGLPISVLEAMATPRACVLSNVVGHYDIGRKSHEVLLHDYDDFVEKISEAITFKGEIELKAYERVKSDFSIEKMAKKTVEVYERLYENC